LRAEKETNDKADARRVNAEGLRRLRERDQKLVKGALERKRERGRVVVEQQERAELLKLKGNRATPRGVERDPDRLVAPTATIERRREQEEEARRAPKSRLMTFGGERGVPPSRRAMPTWRSGV
ncbi:hypothetical protein T492DRAFT_856969, partial [Pavlovales sp. CCMP2436]